MQEAELMLLQYGKTIGIRTLDSIQLATYFLLNETNGVFVASDKNLLDAAEAMGAKTFNPLTD